MLDPENIHSRIMAVFNQNMNVATAIEIAFKSVTKMLTNLTQIDIDADEAIAAIGGYSKLFMEMEENSYREVMRQAGVEEFLKIMESHAKPAN